MDVEGRREVGGRDEGLDVLRDLADLVRRARLPAGHVAEGVAPGAVARVASGEVVVLVRREDEERVRLVDAVGGEAAEERAEGLVVVVQLLHVVGLTRTAGAE